MTKVHRVRIVEAAVEIWVWMTRGVLQSLTCASRLDGGECGSERALALTGRAERAIGTCAIYTAQCPSVGGGCCRLAMASIAVHGLSVRGDSWRTTSVASAERFAFLYRTVRQGAVTTGAWN